MNYETLLYVPSQDMDNEYGEFVGTMPGYYHVATSKREEEYMISQFKARISDNWTEYNRAQYFEAGGDY